MSNQLISVDNWGSPPFNRWSFQHVQALFPTVRIRRGSGPPTGFERAIRDLGMLSYAGPDGSSRTVKQMLDGSYTDSFLVQKNGVIVCEQHFNDMGPDSHHLLNSITKSFTGALAGIAVGDGLIDPDQPVPTYLPEFKNTAFDATTIRHLLDMTAAVKFGEDYADPNADFWFEAAVVGWRPALVHGDSATSLFDFAKQLHST